MKNNFLGKEVGGLIYVYEYICIQNEESQFV